MFGVQCWMLDVGCSALGCDQKWVVNRSSSSSFSLSHHRKPQKFEEEDENDDEMPSPTLNHTLDPPCSNQSLDTHVIKAPGKRRPQGNEKGNQPIGYRV